MKKLIITGFVRSGTSLLTKFLHDLGYDTGGNWGEELNAGYEDEQTQKIVTTFQSNPFSEELILFLEKEIEKIDKIIVKHPRFLINPEIMRIWTNIHPETSILVTYREPFHALESKKSHGNLGYFTSFSPTELDIKFKEFINILINLRIKHKILIFPNFIENYNEVYHTIHSLGIYFNKEKGQQIWEEIIDINKVHFK